MLTDKSPFPSKRPSSGYNNRSLDLITCFFISIKDHQFRTAAIIRPGPVNHHLKKNNIGFVVSRKIFLRARFYGQGCVILGQRPSLRPSWLRRARQNGQNSVTQKRREILFILFILSKKMIGLPARPPSSGAGGRALARVSNIR